MSDRAVLLIVADSRLLLVHRRKGGQEYHVLPGGGIEPGETPEGAAMRESLEETGLVVVLGERLATLENGTRREHYFRVASFTREPAIGGPERDRQSDDNQYALVWVTLAELETVPLRPEAARGVCRALLGSLQ